MTATAALISEEIEEQGPLRRCLVTGEARPKAELVRFVVGPDRRIVPDIAERLPGRGLWTLARRDIVAAAVKKRLFQRAARAQVTAEDDLADCVEALLARRCVDLIGLARRAGLAVAGFAKVEAALRGKGVAVLIAASDGSADGRGKLEALAPGVPRVEALRSAELGAAFARESAVHAALKRGPLAESFLVEAGRLGGFRAGERELSVEQGTAIGSR